MILEADIQLIWLLIITLICFSIFLKIMGVAAKVIIQLVINGIVGFITLLVLNHLHIPVIITWWSTIVAGTLGIPGVVIIIVLKLLITQGTI